MGYRYRASGASFAVMICPTPQELANEIRMTRSQFPGSFLVVEGRDDRLFMETFVVSSACSIKVAFGKENVCRVIQILDDCNFHGALGLIDSDFDRIDTTQRESMNLVMPPYHDLTTMLVCSTALDRVVREFGSDGKVERFEGNVLDALLERALHIGYLRLYSAIHDLSLRFSGLNHAAWIERRTFTANIGRLIQTVIDHSQAHDLSSDLLLEAIAELRGEGYDPYEICSGADLVEILSLGLQRVLGSNNSGQVDVRLVNAALRLAYSERDFWLSSLRKDIDEWQRQTIGFQILRGDIAHYGDRA